MKYRIGEFSKLTKVTVKTLRYYDSIGILKPAFTDRWNGYRYYTQEQMGLLCTIRDYREAGLSIEEIRTITAGEDPRTILRQKRDVLADRISLIDRMVEKMDSDGNRPVMKTLPEVTIAFMHGTIPAYQDMTSFVMEFAEECRRTNPQLRCSDDYCFVTYTKQEYQDTDIELTYAQAVDEAGAETERIGFRILPETEALCICHRGPYRTLGDSYRAIMEEVSSAGHEVCGDIRECYIDGCWNRDSEDDYLTEIQVPVRV